MRPASVRSGREKLPVGSYFADWVSSQAREAFEAAYGEVMVPTTLDSVLQDRAEEIVSTALKRHGGYLHATQAALSNISGIRAGVMSWSSTGVMRCWARIVSHHGIRNSRNWHNCSPLYRRQSRVNSALPPWYP